MILEIETKKVEPDIAIVQFTGKITLGRESQRIESVVGELLQGGSRKFIFDIAKVDYIDSAGLGMITLCSGKVTQSQRIPWRIDSSGIASMRFIMRMFRSRSCGRVGAKPKPHWPMLIEVTPNQPDSEA